MTTQAVVPIPEGATGPGVASAPPAQQKAGMVPIPQGATGPGLQRIQERKAATAPQEPSTALNRSDLPQVTTSTNPKLAGAMGEAVGASQDTTPNAIATGALKKGLETVHSAGRALNALTGDNISWLPNSMEQPKELETHGAAEGAGGIGEELAEFAMGEGALKAMGGTLKGMSIFEKLEHAQVISQLADKSPFLTKLLTLGMKAARGAAVGGITGEAHGGTGGAEAGAALGAAGELGGAALKGAKNLLYPSEELQTQAVRDAIKKAIGNKADSSVIDELTGRVNKESITSPMANELKLAKVKLEEELPQMESQLNGILSGSTAKTGNASRIVNKTFDDLIADVNKGVGTNKEGAVSTINDVRKEVTDKLSNNPMSAEEVNNVKRLIGDQIKKFQPPDLLNTADAQKKEAYRQAYFSLRDIVDQLEPSTKELNTKISRGIDARDVLRSKFPDLETAEQAKRSHGVTIRENKVAPLKKLGKAAAVGAAGAAGYEAINEGRKLLTPTSQ